MPRSQSSGLNRVLWQQRHSERFARSLWRCCVELHTVDGGHATRGHLRGDVPDVDGGIIRKAQRCQLAVYVWNDLAHSSNNHGEAILPRVVGDKYGGRVASGKDRLAAKRDETVSIGAVANDQAIQTAKRIAVGIKVRVDIHERHGVHGEEPMTAIGTGYKRRSGSGRSRGGIGGRTKPDRKRPIAMEVDRAIHGDRNVGIGGGAAHGRGCHQGEQTEEERRQETCAATRVEAARRRSGQVGHVSQGTHAEQGYARGDAAVRWT